ncbi:MFS transporter [Desulfovibrio sp. 86]|uniref:Major facilitator superfamily MFS_1 n=1 Tax=uncultured Desulfovibrio sp. TaxID=167968 RepID=A0A212L1X2_9BACT|nr:MFS transporter [Desulfovibrio sp. 86]SCM71506.1 Major facilitator superfamily MFS_1 [uncultured Desulfovibrio sp.]VZH32916.1 Major facilitator superfamily MFS_1 [Desulfovibrio sp. 86]
MPKRWKYRYTVLVIMFMTYLLCYMDRMVMATAIPFIADEFGLTTLEMGGVMSAFFFSYAILQIPGGILADRFGSRPVMAFGIAWWSVFTAMTAIAKSLNPLILIRVAFGLGEGVFPPAAFKTIAAWFPKKEVGRANGFMLTTNSLGPALAPLFVAGVVAAWGWRSVFLSLLFPGVIIALLVWFFVSNTPQQSKHMSKEELADYEEDEAAAPAVTHKRGIGDVVRMPIVWWCFFTLFFYNIAFWGIASWLPTYLLKSRGFSLSQMGVGASLPFFMGTIGFYLSGHISDKFFRNARQMPVVIGAVIGAVFVYLTAIAPSGNLAIAAQMVGFFFITIGLSAIFTLPVAVMPKEMVGSAAGVVNTAGQIAGFLSPLLVGYILSVTGNNYTIVFNLFVGCLAIAALLSTRIRKATDH